MSPRPSRLSSGPDEASPERERLEGERAAAEGLWLGLRRLGGLDVTRYLERFAVDREWLEARVARQLALGNLVFSEAGALLAVAPGRWLWHDTIAVDLLEPKVESTIAPAGRRA